MGSSVDVLLASTVRQGGDGPLRSDVELREAWERSHPFPKDTPFWTDESFRESVESSLTLKRASAFFPADLSIKIFNGQTEIERLWSSYRDHGYGYLFYALTRVLQPKRCVEIGVLHGFSLLTVAAALRDNGGGTVHGFDLFEKYPYRHEHHGEVLNRIEAMGLPRWAAATQAEAKSVQQRFDEVDYLHVDISNDGDVVRDIFNGWAQKVTQLMVFEGGGPERDRVPWMVAYKRAPIRQALDDMRRAYPDWRIFVLRPYPSLTIALRS